MYATSCSVTRSNLNVLSEGSFKYVLKWSATGILSARFLAIFTKYALNSFTNSLLIKNPETDVFFYFCLKFRSKFSMCFFISFLYKENM